MFTPQTIKRLNWLKTQLTKYPERYNQSNWCGTQACLAGFCIPKALKKRAVTLSYDVVDAVIHGTGYSNFAASWLGITDDQKQKLFIYWPHLFMSAYDKAKTPAERVRIAHKVIDAFIKTDGTFSGYYGIEEND